MIAFVVSRIVADVAAVVAAVLLLLAGRKPRRKDAGPAEVECWQNNCPGDCGQCPPR